MSASIRNTCVRSVITVPATASVTDAAALMRKHHVGALVIVQSVAGKTKPIGVVTDRDIVVEAVAARLDGDKVTVGEITQRPVVTVGADASPSQVVREMTVSGVRRLPVVDDDGALVGIVALDDLLLDLVAPLVAIGELAARERQFEARTRAA
jgi:CBS domain-containing protein